MIQHDPSVQTIASPPSLPARPLCGGPSRKREARALAGGLLLGLALAQRLHAPALPWPELAAAAGLGACLWWVAQRQTSHAGALLALGFYAALRPADPAPALGLFAMVFTATGVAHALQGPRRKWPPRIGLMAGATLFTAFVSPPACAAALVLALPCAVWLAERRRGVLLLCFGLWAALGGGVVLLCLSFRTAVGGIVASAILPGAHFGVVAPHFRLTMALPLVAALIAALAFYCVRPRSRFYGNTVPLLLTPALVPLGVTVALPFALLFLAGIAADAFAGARGQLWRAALWACAGLQLALSFLP